VASPDKTPRLLDLFCGAGGAAMGYHRAGFEVVGVDIAPQPHYPFEFVQADVLSLPLEWGLSTNWWSGFDAIHASPPCQRYSHAAKLNPGSRDRHPDLIGPTRELLIESGLPYVIENVEGARSELSHPFLLCGSMFGIKIRRHRLFETTFPLIVPACQHGVEATYPQIHVTTTKRDGLKHLRGIVNAAATGSTMNIDNLRSEMGVDWITSRAGVTEAIPPAYTELIGHQLMQHIRQGVAA